LNGSSSSHGEHRNDGSSPTAHRAPAGGEPDDVEHRAISLYRPFGMAASARSDGTVKGFELTGPIETERLTLRAFVPDDFPAVHAMQSDESVARYLYWEPRSEEGSRTALRKKIAARALRDEGDVLSVAAILRSTGELVADLVLVLVSEEHRQGEVGYIVPPAHQGQGYATEATRELLRIAFDDLSLHRVVGKLEARNVGSARVLEKLGMRREAHLVENEWVKGEWQSELIYAILDREWRAATHGIAPS
jgi:RimJ/RimL family protein N-acetyltransferase